MPENVATIMYVGDVVIIKQSEWERLLKVLDIGNDARVSVGTIEITIATDVIQKE